MANCSLFEDEQLPTRAAAAVPASALQASSGESIPGTFTPVVSGAGNTQATWGTLQPTGSPIGATSIPFQPTETVPGTTATVIIPATNTPVSPTDTPIVVPTATALPNETNTPVPPTATAVIPTNTPIPTATPTPLPTSLPPTDTPVPPTSTPTSTPTTVPGPPGVSPVYREAVYPVTAILDVVYGQGLRRDGWEDPGGVVMNLTLDIYRPPAGAELRPAILLYHGGGFQGGSSTFPNMTRTAEYFAARGWVVFVANYRLEDDHGSIPADWPAEPGPVIYPAGRDAKAAVRWVHANAAQYNVSLGHITVMGGSAGGMLALMLGLSDAPDYRDEISINDDPTLLTTNLNAAADVHTVIMLWGNDILLYGLEVYDGRNRYDGGDTPTMLVHGTDDDVIPISEAQRIFSMLQNVGVPAEFHILAGEGHSAWDAVLGDGRTIYEASFDFIVLQQGLTVGD